MRFTIDVNDEQVRRGLTRLRIVSEDMTPAMRRIANHLQAGVERRFRRKTGPAGQPWQDLSDVTKARRKKKGRVPIQKLVSSGKLLRSFHADYDSNRAVVGTGVEYASTHQYGAERGEFGSFSVVARTVRGRAGQRRRGKEIKRANLAGTLGIESFDGGSIGAPPRTKGRPIPWGDIPARPFLGFDDKDSANVLDVITDHLERSFRQ